MSSLCTRLNDTRKTLADTAAATGVPEPVLIAVSKTFPAADIRTLYAAGQRDFGENYLQEFAGKAEELADLSNICWHLIGHIQSNKSRIAAERAHWIHTLDSAKLAERLNRQRPADKPPLNVLIEINIGGEPQKHGIAAEPVLLRELAGQIAALPKLNLRGLMCIAENSGDEEKLHQQFSRMRELLHFLQSEGFAVDTLSMGMSGDWPQALACGASHVRIGSAIFGKRG